MDRSLRDLERTFRATPDDEQAARAFLVRLARDEQGDGRARAGVPSLPLPVTRQTFALHRGETTTPEVDAARFEGGRFLGPLLAFEAERLRAIDPEALEIDAVGFAWLRALEERGRALFEATLRVRLLGLERIGHDAPDTFATWCALHVAIDAGGDDALEALVRVVATGTRRAGDRAARLLASRPEPRIGRRLARLARDAASEVRPRVYAALEKGSVPLDTIAKDDIRAAIHRELPGPLRERAYRALARAATRDDLESDLATGKPEMRAAALETLVPRSTATDASELVRHGLADRDAEVRRAALRILGSPRWLRHPRAIDWALGRLVDADRTVRHDAIRLVRRTGVSARQMERLKLIVTSAPPGQKPLLERLLEQVARA